MQARAFALRPVAVLILLPAVAQWGAVLEIAARGLWQWLKFAAYGGGGAASVSWAGAQFFLMASVALAGAYAVLMHVGSRSARIGFASTLVGGFVLAVLLLSPLVVMRG